MADVTGITTATIDENGKQLITSDDVRDIIAINLLGSAFWSPDVTFSGFAANGNEYLNGVPTGGRASWAEEPEGPHRGPLSRIPQRFWAILTANELSVIDASDLTLVIRFLASDTIPPSHEVDIQEIISDTGIPGPIPRVVRAQLASPEADGVQSVTVSGYLADFTVVDFETIDIEIPADVDAEPLVDLEFLVIHGAIGIFLEFEPDEDSLNFGSGVGNIGSMRRIAWSDGRLMVVGNNATRFLDFQGDRAWALNELGIYTAGIPSQTGLVYRNKDEYFSSTPFLTSITGVTSSYTAVGYKLGSVAYYVAGTSGGIVVVEWDAGTFAPNESYSSDLEGRGVDTVVDREGTLFILTGPPPMRLIRSFSSWREGPLIPPASAPQFPFSAGGFGRISLRGDIAYTGTRIGVWANDLNDFDDPVLTYGGNLPTTIPIEYALLRASGQDIVDIAVDPETGRLGVLHGNAIDIVNVGTNVLQETLSTATDPDLPLSLLVLNKGFSFGTGGSAGAAIISFVSAAALEYDPVVFGCIEEDGRLFYEMIPDVYQLLADRELPPEIWVGYLQLASDMLLQLISADASRSLLDVPQDYQRKYVHYAFDVAQEMQIDPELTFSGGGSTRFVYSLPGQSIQASWLVADVTDRGYFPLRNGLDQRAYLRWTWTATYTRFDAHSVGYIGYYDPTSLQLQNSLLIGVGDGGRVYLTQVSGIGAANTAITTPVVPLNTEVRFDVTYGGEDAPILTVTVIKTEDDTVLLDAFTFDLRDGPSSELFNASAFGLLNANLTMPNSDSLKVGAVDIRRGTFVEAAISRMEYFEPTLDDIVQDVPFLQDRWCNPTLFWTRTQDFELYRDNSSFLYFPTPPPTFLLAEYVSYDLDLIELNHGLMVDLAGVTSALYKSQVQALHFSYWKGPTIASIQLGIQVLLGLPFSFEAGEVVEINPVFTGDTGEIQIQGSRGVRSYIYPLQVNPVVALGDTVQKFQSLTDGVRVLDWKNSPAWFKPYLGVDPTIPGPTLFSGALNFQNLRGIPTNEIQKYHSFRVEVNSDVFQVTAVPALQGFINSIKTTWKAGLLGIFKELEDDVSIDDDLQIYIGVNFVDHGGGSHITYLVYGAPGEPPYEFEYGQTAPALTYGMFNELFPDDPIDVTLKNTSLVLQNPLINGIATPLAAGASITESIP